jgi:hypothetical protein
LIIIFQQGQAGGQIEAIVKSSTNPMGKWPGWDLPGLLLCHLGRRGSLRQPQLLHQCCQVGVLVRKGLDVAIFMSYLYGGVLKIGSPKSSSRHGWPWLRLTSNLWLGAQWINHLNQTPGWQ